MELRKASKPERRAIAEELLGEEVVQTGVLFAPDFQKYRLTAIDPYYADLHAHNPRTALSFVVTGNFDPAKTMMAMGQMIGVIHPESNPKFDINALPLQLPGAHRTIGVQVSLKSDYYTALMVMRLFNPAIHEAYPDIPSITLHTIDLGAELAPYNLYFTLSTSNSAVLPMASRVTTGNIDNLWNVELDQAGLQQMDVFREEGDPGAELEKNLRAFFYQLDKPQPASTEVSSDATRPLLPDPGAN